MSEFGVCWKSLIWKPAVTDAQQLRTFSRAGWPGFQSQKRTTHPHSRITSHFRPELPARCLFRSPRSAFRVPHSAFTLLELLVVIAIIVVLMALLAPAFTSLKGAGDVTSAAYTIKGVLEQARTYAMANHTYTWVGFYEEDGSKPSAKPTATPGVGRIIISAVASKDGSRYRDALFDAANPPPFDNSVSPRPLNNRVLLAQLGNLIRIENAHLATTQIGPNPPTIVNSYLVGHDQFRSHPASTPAPTPPYVLNPTTFTYPLSGTPYYVFEKSIEFSPKGSATKIDDSLTQVMEIGVQRTHVAVVDGADPNVIAIRVAGIAGNVEIYRR